MHEVSYSLFYHVIPNCLREMVRARLGEWAKGPIHYVVVGVKGTELTNFGGKILQSAFIRYIVRILHCKR